MTPGTRLGPYEIIASIGAGGMGEVWRARDTRLQRDVAIKVLPADCAADADRLRRFEQEARATAALNHPNILAVFDIGTYEGAPYLVEELLKGETLRARLRGGTLPVAKALEIAVQVAQGLAAAHDKGIIHRDLKPENLFITSDDRVKILDFGLAKLDVPARSVAVLTQVSTTPAGTQSGAVLGTVGYMAPEQARGLPVDQRTDVFAFGVVLFEMLFGRRPFEGTTATDTIASILRDEPVLPAGVPAPLGAVVSRCLAKEPARRFQRAAEMRESLDSVRLGLLSKVGAPARPASRSRASGRKKVRALAVLPLVNLSRDPEQEYFADGMTEALIAELAKIQALRVISRTSVMRYKGTSVSLGEIAAELHVDGVVEGSVLRDGQRVRVTAQLIHAATDTHLWAESYERDLTNVLLLQSEVARAIASEIRVALTPEERQRLASARPVVAEAYDACLKGRFHYYKLSREHLDTALRYFHLALERDPGCARAWAGITAVWSAFTDAGFVPPHEAIPKAKAAALRALELDDSLAEVHVSLGNLRFAEWDWSGAETSLRRAIQVDPNSADARFFLADVLITLGRAGEAMAEARRALELDPFSFFIQGFFGWHLVYLGRCDEAIAQLTRTLQMEPDFSSAHLGLWGAHYRRGDLGEALTAARRFFEVLGDHEIVDALDQGRVESGYTGAMGQAARRLAARAQKAHVPAVRIARLWSHAREVDLALEWLERALLWHESPLVHLPVGWDWDNLRPDPRFRSLLRRIGFPQH
ncbi:MAG: protein kinase [Thermoanaerobaculaceae bacterium]